MNKRYELFKWPSEICKTASWIGSAILSYFNLPHNGLVSSTGIITYFLGMQFIAFKLHIKSLAEIGE